METATLLPYRAEMWHRTEPHFSSGILISSQYTGSWFNDVSCQDCGAYNSMQDEMGRAENGATVA